MKYTFDLQDELFGLFINDTEIQKILEIKDITDLKECMNKIRREDQSTELVNNGPKLFFSYVFVPSSTSIQGNYQVNKNLLEFCLYGKYRYETMKLYKAINKVLKKNYEDMRIVSEGQVTIPIAGIYSYCFRVRPLTLS